MAAEKVLVIDEAIDQEIEPGYNPLLDASVNMEDLIEIKEKKLPGKKARFNNRADVETREVHVTGLVLHFSQDLSGSKLKSLLGRTDMEFLYLYADTIILGDKLSFPQTNVTLACRYLLIEAQGTLSTTPEPHAQPFAIGSGGDSRKAGAAGEQAGNLTLLCRTIENKHPADGPVFFLNGGKGQNGEMGGLKPVSPNGNYPLSWSSIEKKVIENDPIEGSASNWAWPDFTGIAKDKIYYASIEPTNFMWGPSDHRRYLKTSIGDQNLPNQDNGADAIASGAGGDGGGGGTVSYLEFETKEKKTGWELKGGDEGISTRIEGGKAAKSSSYYHIFLRAFHKDINYEWNKGDKDSFKPKVWYTNTLTSRDGAAAQGPNGKKGGEGKAEKIPADKNSWLHPVLLETMLQYAKTTFRDGERQKAKWILDHYSGAIKTMPAILKEEMRTAALVREVEFYKRRLDQNLDYYGYPPGWIPRLSVLSNLQVIKESRRDLAQLLYFANRMLKEDEKNTVNVKDLEWTINELRKGLKNAQADISTAFTELPAVQNSIFTLEGEIRDQLTALRSLKAKILREIEDQARAQALFTGSFEILAGVCALVPVGQPYVGQLGGGILKQISKIDINSENPLKEGLNFTSGLSKEVGSFIDKNKDKLKGDLTSGLTKEIDKGTKELNAYSDQVEGTTAALKEAETALTTTFREQEMALLREKIKVVRGINSGGFFSAAEDYADIIADLDGMQQSISSARDITQEQKQELEGKLKKLKTDKAALAAKLKARKAEKAGREKSIETAGKVIKGFTDGISGIAGGIQTMMVEFDENDPEVQAKMEKIKGSKYSKEFETIYTQIAEINRKKLPLTEQLLRLEQMISAGVQRINNNLVQWSVLNDQRVQQVQYGLLPATRAYLKRIVQESWDLLMVECYYMTKSYQYRFIEKINTIQKGLKEMLTDIEKFRNGKDPREMTEEEYRKLFDTVLKSQFKTLAYELLVKLQGGSAKPREDISAPVITADDKNAEGQPILERLNTYGTVNFRLEDIKSSKHGTNAWYHYRIIGISFTDISVTADDPNVAFDFGIRHSGDSIIRATDGKLYYFTSRSSRKDSPKKNLLKGKQPGALHDSIDLQVQSWNASYNGSQRETANKGLTNSTDSNLDEQLLHEFLAGFDLDKEYDSKNKPYKDHYPGATSLLTLQFYDNPENRNFQVTKLSFTVKYEVLR